jgi:methyl-accepting chemotaxis protein
MDGCEQMIASLQRSQRGAAALDSGALDDVLAELQEVRSEVRRVGHNVNQIAAVANGSGQVPDGLAEVQAEMEALSQHLVRIGAAVLDLAAPTEG